MFITRVRLRAIGPVVLGSRSRQDQAWLATEDQERPTQLPPPQSDRKVQGQSAAARSRRARRQVMANRGQRRSVYLLRLQSLRGDDDIRRLRLLLKALLRRL